MGVCVCPLPRRVPCESHISAMPAGFAFNFARKDSIWGSGTYYSCSPSLATNYCHVLQLSDTAFSNHLAGMQGVSGVGTIKNAAPT